MNSGYATNYHYNPCSNNNDKNFFLSCHGKESFLYSVKITPILPNIPFYKDYERLH